MPSHGDTLSQAVSLSTATEVKLLFTFSLGAMAWCSDARGVPRVQGVIGIERPSALTGSWTPLMRTRMLELMEKCEARGRRRRSAKYDEFAAPRQTQKGRFGACDKHP